MEVASTSGGRREQLPTRRGSKILSTILVHHGDIKSGEKSVRQSVTLPGKLAAEVRSMAKNRRLSANRMLVELIEDGLETGSRKEREFFELAERFRNESDPEAAKRLGDQLGRLVCGG